MVSDIVNSCDNTGFTIVNVLIRRFFEFAYYSHMEIIRLLLEFIEINFFDGFNNYTIYHQLMRKVLLRWKTPSLSRAKGLNEIIEICDRIEVLGHLSVNEEGVIQLVEIKLKEGKSIDLFSTLEHFEIIEQLEENEDGILVTMLCTHPMARSAIDLSNIHIQPPYGIDREKGMELRIIGLSSSIRRFVALIRLALPPDSISILSINEEEQSKSWKGVLTNRQREVLTHAINRGFYNLTRDVTLKELAEEMGMARSTYGEHIRRCESEIMKNLLDKL
jgi:predicted DNA binding protein|tara:strand:+ start:67 stop:894 length:828 start_codon:yes stop_codon:yes gene_type:complete